MNIGHVKPMTLWTCWLIEAANAVWNVGQSPTNSCWFMLKSMFHLIWCQCNLTAMWSLSCHLISYEEPSSLPKKDWLSAIADCAELHHLLNKTCTANTCHLHRNLCCYIWRGCCKWAGVCWSTSCTRRCTCLQFLGLECAMQPCISLATWPTTASLPCNQPIRILLVAHASMWLAACSDAAFVNRPHHENWKSKQLAAIDSTIHWCLH